MPRNAHISLSLPGGPERPDPSSARTGNLQHQVEGAPPLLCITKLLWHRGSQAQAVVNLPLGSTDVAQGQSDFSTAAP